jgi:hypothetical protein
MDKRKQKKIKRIAAAYKKPSTHRCSNCNQLGKHFVPPSFGDEGFFMCDAFNTGELSCLTG